MSRINKKQPLSVKENPTESCEKYGNKVHLGSYNDAPEFVKDNEYILNGYRINCDSVSKVTNSLFYLHNETVNVWSHILGMLFVIVLIFYTAIFITSHSTQLSTITSHFNKLTSFTQPILNASDYSFFSKINNVTSSFFEDISSKVNFTHKYNDYVRSIEDIITSIKLNTKNIVKINNITLSISDYINNIYELLLTIRDKLLDLMEIEQIPLVQIGNTNTQIKRWPLFVMLSTAIVCLSLSATFHLFQTHSKTVNTITSRLDYAGISILIAGSCYPPYFYFFQCETFIRNAYLTFISVFAISVFLYSLTSDFHLPERRTLRGSLFLALGLSAAIPIFHLIFFRSTVRGFDTMPRLTFWYIGGISYVSGALMYIKRIPERYLPGKFDYFGNSHQIFHCLIVVGVITHYIGCVDSYVYRYEYSCPK